MENRKKRSREEIAYSKSEVDEDRKNLKEYYTQLKSTLEWYTDRRVFKRASVSFVFTCLSVKDIVNLCAQSKSIHMFCRSELKNNFWRALYISDIHMPLLHNINNKEATTYSYNKELLGLSSARVIKALGLIQREIVAKNSLKKSIRKIGVIDENNERDVTNELKKSFLLNKHAEFNVKMTSICDKWKGLYVDPDLSALKYQIIEALLHMRRQIVICSLRITNTDYKIIKDWTVSMSGGGTAFFLNYLGKGISHNDGVDEDPRLLFDATYVPKNPDFLSLPEEITGRLNSTTFELRMHFVEKIDTKNTTYIHRMNTLGESSYLAHMNTLGESVYGEGKKLNILYKTEPLRLNLPDSLYTEPLTKWKNRMPRENYFPLESCSREIKIKDTTLVVKMSNDTEVSRLVDGEFTMLDKRRLQIFFKEQEFPFFDHDIQNYLIDPVKRLAYLYSSTGKLQKIAGFRSVIANEHYLVENLSNLEL